MTLKPLADARLYTFVDTAYLRGRPPEIVAQQLCDGGADLIQLRAKDLRPEAVRRLAERLLPIANRAGVWLVINDHPAVAAELGAPCCHLGQEDFFDAGHRHLADLRGRLATPPGAPLLRFGLSTHAPEQAQRALAAGPDYVAIGPVYATGTKPTARPVTLEYVRWAATQLTLPWFAIGGINLRTVDDVLAAGARRLCIVSAILEAADIPGACQQFRDRLTSAAR